MSEERLSVLKLLEEGKITVDEATKLLEAVEMPIAAGNTPERRASAAETTTDRDKGSLKQKSKFRLPLQYLKNADFSAAMLQGVQLDGANLEHADLSGANLTNADLRNANLQGADLSGANLHNANFQGANLEGADLSGGNFADTSFQDANLEGADLSGADLAGADLSQQDLSGANLAGASYRDGMVEFAG